MRTNSCTFRFKKSRPTTVFIIQAISNSIHVMYNVIYSIQVRELMSLGHEPNYAGWDN